MEIEDVYEEQKKELEARLEETTSKCRVYEVKAKNYQDQGTNAALEWQRSRLSCTVFKCLLIVKYTGDSMRAL